MIYVFDTSSLNILKDYYPERFPSFWVKFDKLVTEGIVVSVSEVFVELEGKVDRRHIQEWITTNRKIFLPPTPEESLFISEIFAVPHFQYLIKPKYLLTSTAIADPFVIASAKVKQGCVVTEEEIKDNGAKIPNVCKHFGVECENLEGFLKRQNWQF